MRADESAETSSPALVRARQVFRFLKAFAERNLPLQRRLTDQPWSFRLAELPSHPSIALGEVHLARPGEAQWTDDGAADAAPLLRVRRPELTPAVPPPALLLEWIQSGWEDPNGQIVVVRERNVRRGSETITVAFAGDHTRVRALEEWRGRWERWAEAERPARAAMRVFERLYELRGRIELESERVELMLGDGRLRWKAFVGDIDHPVLLQRVEIEFDPDVPEIRLVDADRSSELYGAVLHDLEGVSADTFLHLRAELEAGGFHPLMQDATSAYLRRLVQLLSPRGTFRENPDTIVPGPDPVISRDPTLFLRARITGFPAAFEHVLEDLEHREDLPVSLTRLVGVTPCDDDHEQPAPGSPWGEPPDILLSKPANPEQIEIARALERHRAVLVQGPPGTGKSHTIANLIGHLVAHGKRVLVTSHTTKALRVLRGQLVESLQPLCVAVLENDLEARTQMEHSVRGILSRLTTAHEETLEREVADFAETRAVLNAQIEDLTTDLQAVREAEYRPLVLAGEPVSPADTARWVRDHAEGNDWIPGPLEGGAPTPLDLEQLTELYGVNARVTRSEEGEIDEGLPDLVAIPDPARFRGEVEALTSTEAPDLARFWSREPSVNDLPVLERLFSLVTRAAQELDALARWQRSVVAAGHAGGVERDLWIALQHQVREAVTQWEKARPLVLEHNPEIDSDLPTDETRHCLGQMVAHLSRGRSLDGISLLFNRKWKAVIQGCRINGRPPTAIAHFRALSVYMALREGRCERGHAI